MQPLKQAEFFARFLQVDAKSKYAKDEVTSDEESGSSHWGLCSLCSWCSLWLRFSIDLP